MTGSVDPFHETVARIALQVAHRYGFVLGGGFALILHGALQRPTEDIDLFGPETASVVAAAEAVRTALKDAGIRVADVPTESALWRSYRSPRSRPRRSSMTERSSCTACST